MILQSSTLATTPPGYILTCLVLLHMKHCRLFNAKSSLCMYIRYMICKHILLISFLNKTIQHYSFICKQLNGSKYCYIIPIIQFWHTLKEFQILLFNTNNSIQHYSLICTQVTGSKYCYVSQITHLDSHLFTHN